jgi:homocysteine S-methyltransferase
VGERDRFWDLEDNRAGRVRPLVAASIGPYGAYLADGSEYRGDYDLSAAELYDFHAPRWEVLAETAADVLACETTPSLEETRAYCRLAAVAGRPTWVSFQCRDESSIADGTPLQSVVAICEAEPNVVAVGINCTDPGLTAALLEAAGRGTAKPLLVYPNSGEEWDPLTKTWRGSPVPTDWAAQALAWAGQGAAGIGGCCRVRPADIAEIRRALSG